LWARWGGKGLGLTQLFKPKISPNHIAFTFTKEKKCKLYSYIIKNKIKCCDFFQSCVISDLY
jgi:hypothetical protein